MIRIQPVQQAIESITASIMYFGERLSNAKGDARQEADDEEIKINTERIKTLRQIRETLEDLD